ncbi:MAG: ferrichrome transporter [Proteobacteria bacterium]|nr:ferrichrome transporter [Pseudomonadota bacterium]
MARPKTAQRVNTPAQVPKHMASLWGDYTFYDGALSGLTLGTGARLAGSSYGDPANSFKVGGYTVHGCRCVGALRSGACWPGGLQRRASCE